MKLTFHRKITLSILFTALVVSLLYVSVNITREQSALEERLLQEKMDLSNFLSSAFETAQATAGIAYRYKLIETMAESEDVIYIRIVKPDGEIHLSTEREEMGSFIHDPAIYTSATIVKDDVYNGEDIKVAISPSPSGHTIWIGFSLAAIKRALYATILLNLIIFLPILVMTVLASFILSRSVVEPVQNLIKGVENLRQGNLDYRITVANEDEIGELATAFNNMRIDLKKSRTMVEKNSRNLEQEVAKKTKELQARIEESEKFNRLTVGRELKMIEMKKRVKELEEKLAKK